MNKELKKVFDIKSACEMAKGYDLSVTLKKGPKGVSLYAKNLLNVEMLLHTINLNYILIQIISKVKKMICM